MHFVGIAKGLTPAGGLTSSYSGQSGYFLFAVYLGKVEQSNVPFIVEKKNIAERLQIPECFYFT